MGHITFKRTGRTNKNGSVPGELTVDGKPWPTIERGKRFSFVRQGTYSLVMDRKNTGRAVRCLRFDHNGAHAILIHPAKNNSHLNLEGCIAPGTGSDDRGIRNSDTAMDEIFEALGKFKEGRKATITVENNIRGTETKDEWLKRRQDDGKW